MEREHLRHIALDWIVAGDHAPVPRIWQERIADLCAQFTEMMYGELMRRETHAMVTLQDALNRIPSSPVAIIEEKS